MMWMWQLGAVARPDESAMEGWGEAFSGVAKNVFHHLLCFATVCGSSGCCGMPGTPP